MPRSDQPYSDRACGRADGRRGKQHREGPNPSPRARQSKLGSAHPRGRAFVQWLHRGGSRRCAPASCKTEPDAAAPAAARTTRSGMARANRTGFICEMTRDQRTIQLDDLDAWPSGSAGGWVRSFVLLDAVVSTTDSRFAGVDSQSSERIQYGRSHEELGCAGGPVFTRA